MILHKKYVDCTALRTADFPSFSTDIVKIVFHRLVLQLAETFLKFCQYRYFFMKLEQEFQSISQRIWAIH